MGRQMHLCWSYMVCLDAKRSTQKVTATAIFNVLKGCKALVIGVTQSNSLSFCRLLLSVRAILSTFLLNLLHTFYAPINDHICVLSVRWTAVLIASKFLEAAASWPGKIIWPRCSFYFLKSIIWIVSESLQPEVLVSIPHRCLWLVGDHFLNRRQQHLYIRDTSSIKPQIGLYPMRAVTWQAQSVS